MSDSGRTPEVRLKADTTYETIAGSGALCGPCTAMALTSSASPAVITTWRAFGCYEGSLRRIIHAFKYHGHRSIAGPLGAAMRIAGRDVLRDADMAVPVPLHVLKHAARGFNQARDLAARLGLPCVTALTRRRATVPQAGLDAGERRRNVRNAFEASAQLRAACWLDALQCSSSSIRRGAGTAVPHARWSIRDRTVVLVDDVRTTGATLEACAGVLSAWGAREVRVLTAAAVVRE